MEYKDLYKLFQLVHLFVSKYEFNQIALKQYRVMTNYEVWLVDFYGENYNVIRISFFSPKEFENDQRIVDGYLEYLKGVKVFTNEIKFLDIHLSKEEYDKSLEPHDYINIEDNYVAGVDLHNIFPEIYDTVHNVSDGAAELENLSSKIKKAIAEREKAQPFLQRHRYLFTYIIIGICTSIYMASYFLSRTYDQSAVLLLLGADYKTLTLGCNEYYRLITYAFVHGSLIHLLANMASLYSLGRYVEYRFGHLKYLLILFFSLVCGCLTQGILTDNTICVGMSAGIYGLFIVFILDAIKRRFVDLKTLAPTIILNIFINFLSSTAWLAHLGGAVGGFTLYYTITNRKKYSGYILPALLFLSLVIKYMSLKTIRPIYGGTDSLYLDLLKEFGVNTANLKQKLLTCYQKFGG